MSKAAGFIHDNKNNKTVDWWTPKWVFDELGCKFDLDPASPAGGVPWIPAASYYAITEGKDGLYEPWFGNVWLNPPYGKQTPDWLQKMSKHGKGIALVFARTDCKWFYDYIVKANAILFLRDHIKFIDGSKKTKSGGPGCGSVLVAWGTENAMALQRMSTRGVFVQNRRYRQTTGV